MTTVKCEGSDSTNATTDKQDRLDFLKEKSQIFQGQTELLRIELITSNDKELPELVKTEEGLHTQKQRNVQNRLRKILDSAREALLSEKIGERVVEDPREGLTRRYANYIPVPRYQFTEDTLNIFYPNVDKKFYTKLSDTWNMEHEGSFLRNTLEKDLTLLTYVEKFGESDEVIEDYKQFRETCCENKGILQRYRVFREKTSKKRATFHTPGISVKIDEELNETTIIKTHRELFCRRCEVYDCQYHGILDAAIMTHPQKGDSKEMLASYNEMMEKSTGENKGMKICGTTCYMNGPTEKKEKLLSEAEIAKIKLALQIFKFEPCHIRLYFDKEEMTCHQIYQYLETEYAEIKTESENCVNEFIESGPKTKQVKVVKKSQKKPKIKGKTRFFDGWKKPRSKAPGPDATDYKPCYHRYHDKACSEEEKSCTRNCACFARGFCDKYCGCDPMKCKIRRKGCECKGNCLINKCACWAMNAECDPDLCKGCFETAANSGKSKANDCHNQMIYFNKRKLCKVGPSEVCTGLGLFNIEPIKKGEFVTIYLGELISWDEAMMREQHNFYDQETYLCTVTDEYVIDAKYRGNKSRFINHGKNFANLVARNCFSKGAHHFAFYAKDDLAPGTELLFDYEGGGSALREQFPWIRQPKPPKNHQVCEEDSSLRALKTGSKLNLGFKMRFPLNAKPRKFIKIERNQGEEEEEEYSAYEEIPEDKDEGGQDLFLN